MKFDKVENYRDYGVIKAENKEQCVVCGEETNFIDYCFEARLCSEECQDKLIDLMF